MIRTTSVFVIAGGVSVEMATCRWTMDNEQWDVNKSQLNAFNNVNSNTETV
jgi:hypothetical protein